MDEEICNSGLLSLNPLVSVHMITYQHAPYIKQAIESILMQKVDFPYEICIGEDGSTDGTREICKKFASEYPDKIRLILRDRSNCHRSEFLAPYMFNWAKTFDACRGKYTALLEGDDYWTSPYKLKAQVDMLESNESLGATCHYSLSMPEERPWAANVAPGRPIGSFTIQKILDREVGNIHTSTWVLRRRHRVEWNRFRTSIFGDFPVFVTALLGGYAQMIPEVWSVYRLHGGGVYSPLSTEKRWDANVNLWECLRSSVPATVHDSANIGLSRSLTSYTRALCKNRRYSAAVACVRRNLAEIRKLPNKRLRTRLRFLAIEALLLPHMEGLRNRLQNRGV